jgi:hypothetical protein
MFKLVAYQVEQHSCSHKAPHPDVLVRYWPLPQAMTGSSRLSKTKVTVTCTKKSIRIYTYFRVLGQNERINDEGLWDQS